MNLKYKIKKYLGIDKIGFEIDKSCEEKVKRKLDKEDFERYVECFDCGVLVRRHKANLLAVLEKDINDGVLSAYTLHRGMMSMMQDVDIREDSRTLYFCKACKAELPKPKKSKKGLFSTFL